VLIHAIATGWDARGRHFHALFQFQLMGICGAFLTGDVFNLFVFFEVLLIASYGLMIHSGGGTGCARAAIRGDEPRRLDAVPVRAGHALCLDRHAQHRRPGRAIPEIPAEEAALVRVAAMLLMMVFAVKAALFPVQFWLPATYANAPAPVAALFAIMTKVGAYAILRSTHGSSARACRGPRDLAGTWLFPAAIVTIAVGAFGVLGARLMPLIAFSVVGSMGTLLVAVACSRCDDRGALLHGAFDLRGGLPVPGRRSRRHATRGDALSAEPPTVQNGLFAALFFAAAIAMAGMPPLSGFLGKLLVLDAMRAPGLIGWAWTAILLGSLLTIVGFARAGSTLFWKSTAVPSTAPKRGRCRPTAARHGDAGRADNADAGRAGRAGGLARAGVRLSGHLRRAAVRPRGLYRRRPRSRQRRAEPC
jgi:multicomponent K+:H+ antiporter subunit D